MCERKGVELFSKVFLYVLLLMWVFGFFLGVRRVYGWCFLFVDVFLIYRGGMLVFRFFVG